MAEPLKTELETFDRLKQELLQDEGKFALICGDKLIGTFGTYEDAMKIGYSQCGVGSFLVKKIQSIEPINWFSRDLVANT